MSQPSSQNYQKSARQGSSVSCGQGCQKSVRWDCRTNCCSADSCPECVSSARRQSTAMGSLLRASLAHLPSSAGSSLKTTPSLSSNATNLRMVEQLRSEQSLKTLSNTGYFLLWRSTSSANLQPTAQACGPLQAMRMFSTFPSWYSRADPRQRFSRTFRRKEMAVSLSSFSTKARKKGRRRLRSPSTGVVARPESAEMAAVTLRKQATCQAVSTWQPSSRMMLKSLRCYSYSCQREEVSWERDLKLALSPVEGILPLISTHCPLSLGGSMTAQPSMRISSLNKSSGALKSLSSLRMSSFCGRVWNLPRWQQMVRSACPFSLAASSTCSRASCSRRSLRMNLRAVSSSRRVSSSMKAWRAAKLSCSISASAPWLFTIWSMKLGLVNSVIYSPTPHPQPLPHQTHNCAKLHIHPQNSFHNTMLPPAISPTATLFLLLLAAALALPVPQTFGFMTVTHARAGDHTQFQRYLARYGPMDCPALTEINVVWNNPEAPEAVGALKGSQTWKRPVNFLRTPNNSMNWRYKVPPESKEKVYFSIDDDITVDCQELMKGFQVWQAHAVGQIGPIVSYGPRFYEFTLKGEFAYGRGKQKDWFSMALVGLAFVSRHFMDLYYVEQWQAIQMRKYVVEKNNCDDIGLNWLVQYYYPELPPVIVEGNLMNISPAVAQATSATHYPYRSSCIKRFTEIFGLNTLRYAPIRDKEKGKEGRSIPLKNETVLAKQQYIEIALLKHQWNGEDYTFKKEEIKKNVEKKVEDKIEDKINEEILIVKKEVDSLKLEKQHWQREQLQLKQSIKDLQRQIAACKTIVSVSSQPQSLPKAQPDFFELSLRTYFQLLLLLVIFYLLNKVCRSQNHKTFHSSTQFETINLSEISSPH